MKCRNEYRKRKKKRSYREVERERLMWVILFCHSDWLDNSENNSIQSFCV